MIENFSTQLADIHDPNISASVWHLVKMCDKEFVPPLSSRNSTVSRNLKNELLITTDEPVTYFEMLKTQYLLIARYLNAIVGFMSFRNRYSADELNGWNPSNYITTICIDKNYRKHGIGSALYRTILNRLPNELKCDFTSTRTWEGNDQHLVLLRSIGFHLVYYAENDRGLGIGSLYWVK